MVNLKLISNHHHTEYVAVKNVHVVASINSYAPHIVQTAAPQKTHNYALLTALIVAHIVGVVSVIHAAQINPKEKVAPAHMMVSLVESPAPEPEVIPLVPTPPAPIIKPQKPVIKKVEKPQPVVEEVVSQPVQAAPVVAEVPVVAPVAPAKVEEAPIIAPAPEPVIEPPKFGAAYLHNPAPNYPSISRRMGEEGRTLLRVLVSENGAAAKVQIDTSSGSARLDEAAMKAVKEWRFIPAKRNQQNISAYVLVPIKFSLEN